MVLMEVGTIRDNDGRSFQGTWIHLINFLPYFTRETTFCGHLFPFLCIKPLLKRGSKRIKPLLKKGYPERKEVAPLLSFLLE